MNSENEQKVPAGRESGGSCCTGPGKWIWLLLAAALIAVVVARNAKKSDVSPAGTASPTVQTDAAAPAQTVPGAAQKQALPRLVDLGATKCIPCKMMAPILEDLKKTHAGQFEVHFIDVWENPAAGEQYGIKLIPTQIFYDAAGKELFRHEGFFGKEDILAKWKELGVDPTAN